MDPVTIGFLLTGLAVILGLAKEPKKEPPPKEEYDLELKGKLKKH